MKKEEKKLQHKHVSSGKKKKFAKVNGEIYLCAFSPSNE